MNRLLLALSVFLALSGTASSYTLWSLKWTTITPTFYVNTTNYNNMPASSVETDLRAGAEVWRVSGSSYTMNWGGRVSDTTQGNNGRSVALFRNTTNPDNTSVLASTGCWVKNGVLWDCDITFWKKAWFVGATGCAYGYYIRDIASHEYGHAATILHSTVTTATMYYKAARCNTSWRVLDADDIAAIRAQYP